MKSQIILAGVGLTCGCVIMATSLVHASEVYSPSEIASTSQEIALHDPVVPGHVLYPVAAAGHRLKILLSTPEDRPFVQIATAQSRLKAGVTLVEMDKTGAATQTLWKGHHYLVLLMDAHRNQPLPANVVRQLEQALVDYRDAIVEYKHFFSDNQIATLDQLLAANAVLIAELQQ